MKRFIYYSLFVLIICSNVFATESQQEMYEYIRNGDYTAAFPLIKRYAGEGEPDAIYALAIFYEEGHVVTKNTEKAINLYQEAALKGHERSMNNLARYYYVESDTKDIEKAKYWFIKSADLGNPVAKFNLAFMMMRGDGFVVDYEKGRSLLMEVEGEVNGSAQYYLGLMYEHGLGVEKDVEKAYQWYRKSALLGFEKSQNKLATSNH